MIEMPVPDQRIIAKRDFLADSLRRIVPAEQVIHTAEELKAYECDGLNAYRQPPMLVVLPDTTDQVSRIVRLCAAEGVPIVPRGSGTSLAGGSLPTADAVVLGLARMKDVMHIDYNNRTIRVQTGITNLAVTGAVQPDGFFYAPDPSSQLACAIGGNIAMNSGGAHCLKYGVTTNNLLGVTMVMADGDVVEFGGSYLDAGGYDFLSLICGAEGQLGIVTEATLKILPAAEGARPMLFGFDTNEVAGEAVAAIIRAGLSPVALEFMDKPAIVVSENFAKAGYPLDVEALLIVEVEGSDEEIDAQLTRIEAVVAPFGPTTVKRSGNDIESARIWAGRKAAFGAIGQLADYICLDGCVPLSQLPDVLKQTAELAKKYDLKVANVFHAGDGNLHPLIMYEANDPDSARKAEELGADLLRLCVEKDGCLTGEHGVGIEKRELMLTQFNERELRQQMAIKDVFDPAWMLNPAKVFPLSLSAGHFEGRRAA